MFTTFNTVTYNKFVIKFGNIEYLSLNYYGYIDKVRTEKQNNIVPTYQLYVKMYNTINLQTLTHCK